MILGTGMNGNVVQCVHKATKISYALKRIAKHGIEDNRLNQIRDELNCMAFLDHPNILRIHEVFEDEDRICLVLELCRGGHLMDRLMNQRGRFYREHLACKYIHSILTAVAYCHANNVVHRDLKLENILFETEKKDSELKIIDFGLSRCFVPNKKMHSPCGTSEYVAPEVLAGKYDAKCDVWSVGVIAFILLSGAPPFVGNTDSELFTSIKAGQWQFDQNLLNSVSADAKDFIKQCLNKRVSKRFSAAEALKHKWFLLLKSGTVEEGAPSPVLLQRFSTFVVRTWLAKIFIDVLSHTLHSTDITELRDQFQRFDINGTGVISKEELRVIVKTHLGSENEEEFLNALVLNMDIDQTGKISYHEFLAATINRKHFTDQNLHLAFEAISHNREYITSQDIQKLLGPKSTHNVDVILQEVGLSTDSQIDFEMFKSILNGQDGMNSFLNKYEDL
uniref:non-specific serine/threonine protein kinase n=1 Tax=Spumella elongata TaxID=89044 RepID=A0A7S3HEX0_9STRA